jgi:large subunit ribosomal protein L31
MSPLKVRGVNTLFYINHLYLMKAKIHPIYYENTVIKCGCGNYIIAGSTKKDITTEICSACHPYYTGQQKLVDTAGRVDKFLAKVKKAQKIKENDIKVVDAEIGEMFTDEEKGAVVEKKSAKKTAKKSAKK